MSYQTGVGQRTAVVTGAAAPRGIGYATARRYAQEGWAVALLDIDQNGVNAAAQRLREEFDVPSVGLAVDVTDLDSIQQSVTAIAEAGLPPVGALANIAGLASPVPFLEVDLALWHKVIDVNLTGTFLMCQAYLPADDRARVRADHQHVVGVGPTGRRGVLQDAVLGGEGGDHRLTRSLAREMAAHGITVNAVSPGVVSTDIRAGATDDENEARLAAAVPLGRQATVEDIAALFVWLSSEDSSYITGGTHNINGGSYIG